MQVLLLPALQSWLLQESLPGEKTQWAHKAIGFTPAPEWLSLAWQEASR